MNIDDFERIGVIGWGLSGISVANLLLGLGKKVKVSEQRERGCFSEDSLKQFTKAGVEFEFGGHSESFIKDCQLLVVSPGVDTTRGQIFEIIKALKLPVVGEVELCSWLTKASLIAITGTNGKTTASHLTYEVLRRKRSRVFLGGNIGIPFSSFVLDTKKNDLVVLELSSFQLETIISFRPKVAALLNISPDHFDRHRDLQAYLQAKMNIFRNQTKDDFALFNKNSSLNFEKIMPIRSKIIYFSKEFPNENFSCIYKIASLYGLTKTDCELVFFNFKGLPHRLQLVKTVNGITFINDSKATNPSSTIWALNDLRRPIILLAGGKNKGLDYATLRPYLKQVKKLNLFGEAAEAIRESLKAQVRSEIFSSLDEAVNSSFKEAERGDTVLLSPMCSSFDMFSDYRERGNKFIEIVDSL